MAAELHRIGVKVPMLSGMDVPAEDLIRTFHRWIQERMLPGLLLDVADYSHVHHGPGVLLIAHEGNYAVDESGGRRGLAYYAKHPLPGDLSARIATVFGHALRACVLLEQEPALGGRVRFDAGRLELFSNDRLAAPNTPATQDAITPVLVELLGEIYPARVWRMARDTDARERFTLRMESGAAVAVQEPLSRL